MSRHPQADKPVELCAIDPMPNIFEHFEEYGIEDDKTVLNFGLVNDKNKDSISEAIIRTVWENVNGSGDMNHKFRYIISYDPEYPMLAVKKIFN